MLAALLLLAAPQARDGPPALEGRFVERDRAADQRAVQQGIERVAEAFPGLIRPLVRMYLEGVTRYCAEPAFAWEGPTLIYGCGDKELLRRVPDGQPFVWDIPGSDETPTVTLSLAAPGTLRMAFENELGGRTQSFALQPDGTLREHVVYHGDKLPVPLEYTLVFVAAPPGPPPPLHE
jgi:hypothetical protein